MAEVASVAEVAKDEDQANNSANAAAASQIGDVSPAETESVGVSSRSNSMSPSTRIVNDSDNVPGNPLLFVYVMVAGIEY